MGYDDVYDEYEYGYEMDAENENYLEDGNDFIEINPDSATISLLWLIASFSFVAFGAFALMFLTGSKRRKQQIQAKETKYCQQALQMSEYESESGCDSEQEAINVKE